MNEVIKDPILPNDFHVFRQTKIRKYETRKMEYEIIERTRREVIIFPT